MNAPPRPSTRETDEGAGAHRAFSSDPPPIAGPLDPVALAALMLAIPLGEPSRVALLRPEAAACALVVQRGDVAVASVRVAADVGMAAALRLARMTGLDPLIESTSPEREGNGRRVKARAGGRSGELLVSIGATRDGLEVEVRGLWTHGQEPPSAREPAHEARALKHCPVCETDQPPQRHVCENDGAPLLDVAEDARAGGVIGVYRLGERIGEGGMATVFAAEHAILGRPAAIKVLHQDVASDVMLRRRFLAEARAASGLRHPSIVEVIDFGLLANGHPYLVMERIVGESLQDKLARGGAMDPTEALGVARDVAVALGAAHAGGVVHNDLKPSNIVLLAGEPGAAQRLKLVDFGAASLVGKAGDGWLMGTPKYMAPEHARGDAVDGRADLYALGVVLFEMLSGAPPFMARDAMTLIALHDKSPPPPLTSPGGALPLSVHRLVARALRKRPDERHQGAEEMVSAIDLAAASLQRSDWRRWLP